MIMSVSYFASDAFLWLNSRQLQTFKGLITKDSDAYYKRKKSALNAFI